MEITDSILAVKDIFNRLEESKNTYVYPFPEGTKIKRIDAGGPSHRGVFKGALDFIVDLNTPILASLDGQVVKVVDDHDKYGPTEEFKDDLNYITIRHANGEYSQPSHLAKGSALVKEGDFIHVGQQIGVTGNSGWMTEPHLHLFIFKLDINQPGFKGLKIKFK